jgi:hypothetical protein
MDKHRGAIGSPSASQHGMGSLDGRCLIEHGHEQRLRWSERVWSPPPESNRRPHPYHGCALPTELGGQVDLSALAVSLSVRLPPV